MRVKAIVVALVAVLACVLQGAWAAPKKKPTAPAKQIYSASFFELTNSQIAIKGRDAKLERGAMAAAAMVKGSAAYRTNKLCRPDSKLCPVLAFNKVFKVNVTRAVPIQYAVYVQGITAKPEGSINNFGKRSSLLIGKSKLGFTRTLLNHGPDSYVLVSSSVITMASSVFSGASMGLVGFYRSIVSVTYSDIKFVDSLMSVDSRSTFIAYRSGVSISGKVKPKPFLVQGKFALEEGTMSFTGMPQVIFSNARVWLKNCAFTLTNSNAYFINTEINLQGATITLKNSALILTNFRTKGPDQFLMNNNKGQLKGLPKKIPYPFVTLKTFPVLAIKGTGRLSLSSSST